MFKIGYLFIIGSGTLVGELTSLILLDSLLTKCILLKLLYYLVGSLSYTVSVSKLLFTLEILVLTGLPGD